MKADHAQVNRLLKTARGQIDGILKMVEEDRYCLDISSQIMAAQSILKKANRMVLRAHMDCCVREAVASPMRSWRSWPPCWISWQNKTTPAGEHLLFDGCF